MSEEIMGTVADVKMREPVVEEARNRRMRYMKWVGFEITLMLPGWGKKGGRWSIEKEEHGGCVYLVWRKGIERQEYELTSRFLSLQSCLEQVIADYAEINDVVILSDWKWWCFVDDHIDAIGNDLYVSGVVRAETIV